MKTPLKRRLFLAPALLLLLLAQCSREADTVMESEVIAGIGGSAVGTTAMSVIMAAPANGSSGNPMDSPIVLAFNYPVASTELAGRVTVTGTSSGVCTMNIPLHTGTTHTLTLNTPAAFTAGETVTIVVDSAVPDDPPTRTLDATYNFSFDVGTATTGASGAPYALTGTQYPPSGTGVSVDLPYVELTFSKAVSNVVAGTSFTLDSGATIGAASNPSGNTWRLPITLPLNYSTTYTVWAHGTPSEATAGNRINDGTNDLEDNGVQSWTFTTEAAPGTEPAPSVDRSWTENPSASGIDVYFTTTQTVDVLSANGHCYLIYGTASVATPTTGGTTGGYTSTTFPTAEGNWDGGTSYQILHQIQLSGLTPSTMYYYRVWIDLDGDNVIDATEYSGQYTFTSRRVASIATNTQTGHTVLQNSSGGGYVFWLSNEDGSNYDIYMQYYDTAGAPTLTSPGGYRIWNATADIAEIQAVSVDGSTDAIFVYRYTDNSLYARRVTSTGTVVWGGLDVGITIQAGSTYTVSRDRTVTNFFVGYIDNTTGRPSVKSFTVGGGYNSRCRSPLQTTISNPTLYQPPAAGTSQSIGPLSTIQNIGVGPLVALVTGGDDTAVVDSSTYDGSFGDVTLYCVVTTGGSYGSAVVTTYSDAGHTVTVDTDTPADGVPFQILSSGLYITINDGVDTVLTAGDECSLTLGSTVVETAAVSGDYNGSLGDVTLYIVVTTGGAMGGTAEVRTYRDAGHTLLVDTDYPTSGSAFAIGATGVSFTITDGGDGALVQDDEWNIPVGATYADTCTADLANSDYTQAYGDTTFTLRVTTAGVPNGSGAIVTMLSGATTIDWIYVDDGVPFQIGGNNGGSATGIWVYITDGGDNWLYANDTWTIAAGTAYTDTYAVTGTYTGTSNGTYRVWVSTPGTIYTSPTAGTAVISYTFTDEFGAVTGPTTYTPYDNLGQSLGGGITFTINDIGDNYLATDNDYYFQVSDKITLVNNTTFTRVDVGTYSTTATADFIATCSAASSINAYCWNIANGVYPLHGGGAVWSAVDIASTLGWAGDVADQMVTSYAIADTCYLLAHDTGNTSVGVIRLTGGVNWANQTAGRDPHMVLDYNSGGATERILVASRTAAGTAIQAGSFAPGSGAYTGYTLSMPDNITGNTNTVPRIILADGATAANSQFYVSWFGYNGVATSYQLYSSGFSAAGAQQWATLVYTTATALANLRTRGLFFNDALGGSMTNGILPIWVEGGDLYYEEVDGFGMY
ncbi:MAG: Ig-like domain-containing protein [Spirochaetes bacterium]|nr:Ig-like domain-containing protein [Spirochaetota bacterium]